MKKVIFMGKDILNKTLPPTLTLTTLDGSKFSSLFQIISQFPEQNDINNKDSFICETSQFPFDDNTFFQIYCILPRTDRRSDYDDYPAQVLQRRNVISKVMEHSIEHCNLEEAFHSLLQYIQEKNLAHSSKYRIIFHKEKRKWQRNSFFKKSEQILITELQIEVLS